VLWAIIGAFDWPVPYMMQVAWCESGGRADADENPGYWGLFQINYWWPDWADPTSNAAAAYAKYVGAGLTPWPNCPR
jgi:hypothetical protein